MALSDMTDLTYDGSQKFRIVLECNAREPDNEGALTGGLLFVVDNNDLNTALKSIALAPFTDQSIETYVDGRYFLARGRDDMKEVAITFNDFGGLKLYKTFYELYQKVQGYYLNEQMWTITITHINSYDGVNETDITFRDCLLTNITDLSYNHSAQNEILDFSVGFKTNNPEMT